MYIHALCGAASENLDSNEKPITYYEAPEIFRLAEKRS